MAEYNLKLNINGVETAIASIEDLEKALKDTTSEMKTLQIGSEAFNQAANNAKTLQGELDKINEKTKNIDTKQTAQSFAKLGETVTGAFAVATSALELFGQQSEDVTKAQAQAQQTLTLVLGARAIAEGVVEGAAAARLLVDKVSLITTELITTAIGAETVAKAAQAAATGTATTAQLALNAAMKAAPYALIISAVVALGAAIFSTEEETRDYNKELDDLATKLSVVTGEIKTQISFNEQLASVSRDLYEATGQVNQAFEETFGSQNVLSGADITLASMQKNADLLREAIGKTDDALKSASGNVEAFQKVQGNSAFIVDQQLATYKQIVEQFSPGGPGTEGDEERIKNQEELLALATKAFKIDQEKVSLTNQLVLLEQKIAATKAEADKKAEDERKKRLEAYQKEVKAVEDIVKVSSEDRLKAEQEFNNKLQQLKIDAIKNDEQRAKAQAELDLQIKLQEIENNRKAEEEKATQAIRAGEKRNAAIEQINQNAKQKEILAAQETAAQLELIDKEYAEKKKIVSDVLVKELAFGDFNLSDRRKKLELDNLSFYQQNRLSQVQLDLQMGRMSIANTLQLIEEERALREQAAITERDKRVEEINFQLEQDKLNAEAQFQQGVIDKEQRDLVITDLEKQAIEERKQAQIQAIDEIEQANRESKERQIELERQQADAIVGIASASTKSLQGLSDLYFAIKMANVKKGSAEEEKAARQQFKINKALAITSTVISTIQGVMNALSAQSVIPEPYGTILKVANAVAVGIAGAANVAKIAATQFQSTGGGGGASTPSAPSGGGGDGGAGTLTTAAAASGGGFTGFTPNLAGGGATPPGGTPTGSGGGTRVYVVESDITDTQNRVRAYETNATF